MPISVAVRSKTWVFTAWILRSEVQIPLTAYLFVPIFLCYAVLYRYTPYDGLTKESDHMSKRKVQKP